ncbi:MAG: ATP-binding protein [Acidimicrobiales bacterium]|nr:MAG: ATP-binding protein [Acidimicrobiales bacterium]
MAYRERVVDSELLARLSAAGAVVIEGPRACGKTATGHHLAASSVLLDVDDNARQAVSVDPSLVLEGPVPRLIDEWQLEPAIWNHVRRAVDDRARPGQFILAGSAVPADDITRHTGAGRITRLQMRPMSLFETGHSSGAVSLSGVLAGQATRALESGMTVVELADRIATGGWPGLLGRTVKQSQSIMRSYLDDVCRVDLGRLDAARRDPAKVARLLRSLARNVTTHAAATTLARDAGGPEGPLDDDVVRGYLVALERLMIVEDQPAWGPHLRSKAVLRAAPKRHFIDPSLAVAALHATPQRLLADLNLFGLLFESLVIRDLRVYAQACDAQVLQYRDNTGLEVDAIVETAGGEWAAFEVKLGPGQINDAAAGLLRFADRIDTDKCGAPAVLGVIVGTGFGYVREDGVAVIPIGALRP